MPENFEIAYKFVFWLLPLPLLMYWILPPLRLKSAALLFPDFEKSEHYTGEKARTAALIKRRNVISWISLLLIWTSLITALSSPRLVAEPELKVKTSRSFLIVADISFSMAQNDWRIEGNRVRRWEAVKYVMKDFIYKRNGDRMALIFFGTNAYIQAPFTSELNTVSQLLEEADVGMAGQMTNIGKAIVKGIDLFEQDTIQSKVMLLLSDGVDAGTDILPLDAAAMAQKDSIKVYTIGIGDPNAPGSDLDEQTLEEIASLTDAKYFRAIDTDRLNQIYDELDTLEPIEYEEESYVPTTLLYHYPLVIAILIALLHGGIISISNLINLRNNG
ncbi:VWA domain-containing protein [Urechidicola sp. KH5]